jgi:hypothetical protein
MMRSVVGAVTLAAALIAANEVLAFDESKYPEFRGQWFRPAGTGVQWDPSNPRGRGQRAPLTPEYQKVLEASLADQAAGGQGNDPTFTCIPPGMPRAMTVPAGRMEAVVLPDVTFIIIEYASQVRRIYTDGRTFPKEFEPSFLGYSIGKWIDEDGDGRYDVLEVETRGFKAPRSFEASGLPLHADNETVIKERIYLDKSNKDQLRDEITTIDNALTQPWTVTKTYRREHNPIWFEYTCAACSPNSLSALTAIVLTVSASPTTSTASP